MHRKAIRATVLAACLAAASFVSVGVANAAQPEPQQADCHSFQQFEGAAAQCEYSYPGTIQVVIECTNTEGAPYPVIIEGPVVPATAYNPSIAECPAGNVLTAHFARYRA